MNWDNILKEIKQIEKEPPKELVKEYIERTKKHVDLVNEFSKKLSYGQALYPEHDKNKFKELLKGYCYYSKPQEKRTPDEQRILDICTLVHIKTAPHHPEYWTKEDLSNFTRDNFTPNGPIDVSNMPNQYIKEMCCDWCSVALEKGNSPFDWFNSVNGTRWIFTKYQQDLIISTLRKLWEN